MPTPLWETERWQVVVPDSPMTPSHLAIIDRQPDRPVAEGASDLLDAFRRSRSALWAVAGSRGFMISFAVNWEPDESGIGEPEPVVGARRVLHVFGRGPDDQVTPVRVMAAAREQREVAEVSPQRVDALREALSVPAEIDVPAPDDHECDGCWPEVLTKQERWRADGVRVIRPRGVMIDAQVIILPLRHVVSLGDLTADEIGSIAARLDEVRDQFGLASGATGLNCFANDGTAARQETPHVHLHVFGRSRGEEVNPFELLAARLGLR